MRRSILLLAFVLVATSLSARPIFYDYDELTKEEKELLGLSVRRSAGANPSLTLVIPREKVQDYERFGVVTKYGAVESFKEFAPQKLPDGSLGFRIVSHPPYRADPKLCLFASGATLLGRINYAGIQFGIPEAKKP